MAVKFGGNDGFAVNKTQKMRFNKNVVTGDGWCAVSSGWLLSLGLYVDWYKKNKWALRLRCPLGVLSGVWIIRLVRLVRLVLLGGWQRLPLPMP